MSDAAHSATPLSRGEGGFRPAAPVRLVHLGVGNFFRAHQAWYTEHSPDAEEWGIAAFTGRSARLADALNAQDNLYTLLTRDAEQDRPEVIGSISRTHAAAEYERWLGYLASPDVRAVTITVTEAGYLRASGGGLDREHPQIVSDVDALRRDGAAPVRSAPARIVAGLAARRAADAGPITLVPCDNLPDNASALSAVVTDLVESVDPGLLSWMEDSVGYVTTMVDRITPRTTPDLVQAVAESTGRQDAAPVATEPFAEWVLSGDFRNGRPAWQDAGATFTDDVTPYEHRKLWLLNGGHSLLAYAGSIRGHETVADAVDDPVVTGWLEDWWNEAARHLDFPTTDVEAYRAALLERFGNPQMRYLLAQVATDGSQKVPVRVLPVLRAERAAGRVPTGATQILAAWVCHLRGLGAPVQDAAAENVVLLAEGKLDDAVRTVLTRLDPAVGGDDEVIAAVVDQATALSRS